MYIIILIVQTKLFSDLHLAKYLDTSTKYFVLFVYISMYVQSMQKML